MKILKLAALPLALLALAGSLAGCDCVVYGGAYCYDGSEDVDLIFPDDEAGLP